MAKEAIKSEAAARNPAAESKARFMLAGFANQAKFLALFTRSTEDDRIAGNISDAIVDERKWAMIAEIIWGGA